MIRTEQVVSSIPGSVGYISYPMFIEPLITRVSSGFSGYTWLDTKIVSLQVTRICINFSTVYNDTLVAKGLNTIRFDLIKACRTHSSKVSVNSVEARTTESVSGIDPN